MWASSTQSNVLWTAYGPPSETGRFYWEIKCLEPILAHTFRTWRTTMRSKSDSENSRRPSTSGFKREATGCFLLRWLKIAERQYSINQSIFTCNRKHEGTNSTAIMFVCWPEFCEGFSFLFFAVFFSPWRLIRQVVRKFIGGICVVP